MSKNGKPGAEDAPETGALPEMAGSEAKRLPGALAQSAGRARPCVLLIADRESTVSIFRSIAAEGGQELLVAQTLVSGLALMEKNKARAVFFQDQMSGFSGEFLARHVMNVAGRKAKRYLLADAAVAPAVADLVDGVIDTGEPSAAQSDRIRRLFSTRAGGRGKAAGSKAQRQADQPSIVPAQQSGAQVAFAEVATRAAQDGRKRAAQSLAEIDERQLSLLSWRPEQAEPEPFARQLAVENDRQVDGGEVSFKARAVPARRSKKGCAGKSAPDAAPPAAEPAAAAVVAEKPAPEAEPAPVQDSAQPPAAAAAGSAAEAAALAAGFRITRTGVGSAFLALSRSRLMYVTAIAALLALGAALYAAIRPVPAPQPAAALLQPQAAPQPAPQPAVASEAVPGKPAYPFLASCAPDQNYAEAHPGWERYVDRTLEYKLFRENGALRTVQVIDHGEGAAAGDELGGVSSQLVAGRKVTAGAAYRDGGYEIQRSEIEGGGKLVSYRKLPGRRLRALVIDLAPSAKR